MFYSVAGLRLLLCSLCQASSLLAYAQPQKLLFDQSAAVIRPAIQADLDDITTVIIDAFSPGALWRYSFPFWKDHQHYLWRCLRKELGESFANMHNSTFLNVITVPAGMDQDSNSDEDAIRMTVAIAVWESMAPRPERQEPPAGTSYYLNLHAKCSDHLEANMTRLDDVDRQFNATHKHYIEDFPREQLYLGLLATHPDWDGHGFGARHVQWGLDLAKNKNVPVTLIATPAGWRLYDGLGFESLANITYKTFEWEEDEELWFEYMRRESDCAGRSKSI